MGFFDWAFKQRYDTEKQLLQAMLTQTESWHNELTEPLKDFLFKMKVDSRSFELQREQALSIAKELYFKKIESNHGNYLSNTIDQMSENGIPLFTSRHKLQKRAREYLDSGHFLKDIINCFANWDSVPEMYRYQYKSQVRDAWERFKTCKDRLVTEINRQIRRLG